MLVAILVHWNGSRKRIKRLRFRVIELNFRTIRKKALSFQDSYHYTCNNTYEYSKIPYKFIWCELRMLVKQFVETVYNYYFYFCFHFRLGPGTIADYHEAYNEIDIGINPLRNRLLRACLTAPNTREMSISVESGTRKGEFPLEPERFINCKETQIQINPSLWKSSRWGMISIKMIIITVNIYGVFQYVPVKWSTLSEHQLITVNLFSRFFNYSPLSFGETKAQETKICPRAKLAKTKPENNGIQI